VGEANGTRLSCARCEYARLFCGANGPTIRKPVSPLVYARLTSGYASRDFYKSETPKTTGGLYRVPSKVFALLVNKSSTNEVNMDCRSAGKFTVARRAGCYCCRGKGYALGTCSVVRIQILLTSWSMAD
jgi:hypothetical protein